MTFNNYYWSCVEINLFVSQSSTGNQGWHIWILFYVLYSSKNAVFFQIILKNNLTSSTYNKTIHKIPKKKKKKISLEIYTIQNECFESIQVHFFLHGNVFLFMAPDFNSIIVGESHNKCLASLYYSPNHPYFLSPEALCLVGPFPLAVK